MARLEAFASLMAKWTPKINLIAKGTLGDIWDRHIVDSAQIYRHAPEDFATWADIGSGGGFPGIVVAAIAKEKHPDARFVLIESDQRKCAFLRTAARALDMSVDVIASRIEEAPPQAADVVSARALAPLPALLPLILRHLREDGRALVHKGRQAAQEVAEARVQWAFDLEDHPSITDPDARLLQIQRILPRGN
ncbi:16S rRNA (guanine(527)-N(7))-methyltransferase RsmG [Yoonia sp.]|uniref:16S rRNA (guanine(527)-N(7))-methyltransferase RsmG n=1 Tax=Yoonia sp. TaxID=2212373 RepID=UPI002FDB9562